MVMALMYNRSSLELGELAGERNASSTAAAKLEKQSAGRLKAILKVDLGKHDAHVG